MSRAAPRENDNPSRIGARKRRAIFIWLHGGRKRDERLCWMRPRVSVSQAQQHQIDEPTETIEKLRQQAALPALTVLVLVIRTATKTTTSL